MARGAGSWNLPITRSLSASIASSSCTMVSGGRPPSFLLRDIEPRDGEKRMPSFSAASNCRVMKLPPAPSRVEVQVIRRAGASGLQQLAHGQEGRIVDRLLVDVLPDLVQVDQPVEELRVLGPREVAREGLEEVMMSVHEARDNDVMGAVDHPGPAGSGEGPARSC